MWQFWIAGLVLLFVAGFKPGRTSADEITIFDSTGMALQDVAAAVVVYQRALAEGAGKTITFAE